MKGLEQIRADEAALARARLVADGKCPHTDTFHDRSAHIEYSPGVEATPIDRHQDTGEPILSVFVEARRCHDCGAWLSLGPSRDDSPQVALEMRAAELAGNERISPEQWPFGMSNDEANGWVCRKHDSTLIEPRDSHWSGYLAAQIAHHEEPSE